MSKKAAHLKNRWIEGERPKMGTQKTSECQDLMEFWNFFLNKIHKDLYDTTAATSSSIQCVTASVQLSPSTIKKIPMYSYEQHSLDLAKHFLDVDKQPEPLMHSPVPQQPKKFVLSHSRSTCVSYKDPSHWNHNPIWEDLIHLGTYLPDSRAYTHIYEIK